MVQLSEFPIITHMILHLEGPRFIPERVQAPILDILTRLQPCITLIITQENFKIWAKFWKIVGGPPKKNIKNPNEIILDKQYRGHI